MPKVSVIIPNLNGAEHLPPVLDALQSQSLKPHVIVVDNGSTDASRAIVYSQYPEVEVIPEPVNLGFAGGVNSGLRRAMELDYDFAALLNNDAVPDKDWLSELVASLEKNPKTGIAASKMFDANGEYLDSTGELYSTWGLPFPRGRREADTGQYDEQTEVFGASGGASLYRIKMLQEIGLFDENFFAYYEDVDLSFRAQLAGWKVLFVPQAIVHHQIGGTSSKFKSFYTYHTLKNLPWLFWKNVPLGLMFKIGIRLFVVWWAFALRALVRGQFGAFFKALFVGLLLWPKKMVERWRIQKTRQVSTEYIKSMLTHDLPPDATSLRRLRNLGRKS